MLIRPLMSGRFQYCRQDADEHGEPRLPPDGKGTGFHTLFSSQGARATRHPLERGQRPRGGVRAPTGDGSRLGRHRQPGRSTALRRAGRTAPSRPPGPCRAGASGSTLRVGVGRRARRRAGPLPARPRGGPRRWRPPGRARTSSLRQPDQAVPRSHAVGDRRPRERRRGRRAPGGPGRTRSSAASPGARVRGTGPRSPRAIARFSSFGLHRPVGEPALHPRPPRRAPGGAEPQVLRDQLVGDRHQLAELSSGGP